MRNLKLKNATPEQLILINAVETLAWWVEPVTIAPLYYNGAIGGSEFVTYDAKKLYLCFALSFNGVGSGAAVMANINIYNELNGAVFDINAGNAYWNATGAAVNYSSVSVKWSNIYFSRIVNTGYNKMMFCGYKLTKP